MDALPVRESSLESRVPVKEKFCSEIEGCSHACGHDGHMAIGLSLAHYIASEIDNLKSDYILIFQPAEEGVRGAAGMCNAWKYGKIDELYCCHIGFAPEDTFVAGAEGFLATTKLDLAFHGKSAHAGLAPERGKNALLAAARAAIEMEEIPRPKEGITRLNVGKLSGGQARNAIPESAKMQLETRGQTKELNEYMKRQALRCVDRSCARYQVSYDISYKGESISGKSSPELARQVYEKACQIKAFPDNLVSYHFGASDDGAVFMDMVQKQGGQAVYMLFGCKTTGLHHESVFDFDPEVLERALKILKETAML